MSVFRHSVLLFVMMVVLLATDPVCLADKQAKIPKFEPPVQNYAVIDISGTKATSPVTMIALNDDNHAAFGFGTGDAVPNVASYTTYQVYTWSNGTSTPLEPVTWVHFGGYDSISHTSSWSVANPEWLTPSGAVYANGFNVDVFDNGGEMRFSADMIGCPDLPNPPYGTSSNSHGTQYYRNWIGCVSDRGYVGGGGVSSLPDGSQPWGCYYGFIKDLDGKFTLFRDANSITNGWSNEPRPVEGKVIVNANTFYPGKVNNRGQAIGYADSSGPCVFWDGTNLMPIGKGEATDLNDQGQVILQDNTGDSLASYEGAFWENGPTTILRDKLPIWFQPQDWNIQPTAISNQVKPVPQFPGDSTLYILANADGIDVGAYRKILWTRDNNGKWSFANVALPAGTTIDWFGPINSSGVIAAIGNGGHALLLFPINLDIWNGQNPNKPVPDGSKRSVGAFTVANLNDTDGDGNVDNTQSPVPSEVDLMKLHIGGYKGLAGRVKLSANTTNVKFWADSSKTTAFPVENGGVYFTLPQSSEINQIVWAEVTAPSSSVRDIEIREGYEDPQKNFQDRKDWVNATAVWAEYTGRRNTLGEKMYDDAPQRMKDYFDVFWHDGFGPNFTGAADFGYCICLEFTVHPSGIANEKTVKFDLTQQVHDDQDWRKLKSGILDSTPAATPPTGDIPNDPPPDYCVSAIPIHDHMYIFDAPGRSRKGVPSLITDYLRVFNASDYMRVKFDGGEFSSTVADGSRCSSKQQWHAVMSLHNSNGVYTIDKTKTNEVEIGYQDPEKVSKP